MKDKDGQVVKDDRIYRKQKSKSKARAAILGRHSEELSKLKSTYLSKYKESMPNVSEKRLLKISSREAENRLLKNHIGELHAEISRLRQEEQ